MTGSWIDNGDGTYTQSNSGVMSQFDPSIVNTGYNPINDTAYNTGSVYDSYGNYNPGYGSGLGGTFDATYYDPTATASAWGYGNTEGGTALQNYWLGANQDWSSPLGASSYGTSSPYDWSMTDGASTPYYDAPIYSNGYDSGYTDLGSFEDWSDYYGTTRAALSTSGRAKANSYQSNDLIYFMYPEVGRYWARTEEILTDARTIVVGD